MSVLVECYSVIVRRSAIEQRFPGGFDAYAATIPPTIAATVSVSPPAATAVSTAPCTPSGCA